MHGEKIKIVVFGARHTGQGPLGRAWGKTNADLPDLQPVVIYEREIEHDGRITNVAAWILSLDPQFDYMRKVMYTNADAFIYTFDSTDITGKSMQYLDQYIEEARATCKPFPPEIVVASNPDPTITAKPEKSTTIIKSWLKKYGNPPLFDLDMTDKRSFFSTAEAIFGKAISMIFMENR
jgi:hypothetical protein